MPTPTRQRLTLLTPSDSASYSITIQNDTFGSQSPALVYLSQLAPQSQATQAHALAVLARLLGYPDPLRCPWPALRPVHTLALRAHLATRYAPATANRLLAALRGVLRAARRLGLMSADDALAAGDVPPVRGQTLLRGRALTRDELRALLRACAADAGPAGRRDAALLALGYAGGLRRAEIVALNLADYEPTEGRVTVQHGKGNKARTVYVAGDWGRLIDSWIRARGGQAGPLLSAISKSGRILDRRLTPPAVRWLLRRRVDQARIALCSPHDLRRSMISDLLDRGVDIATAQRIAGHASVTTTARYDRRGEAAKQRAAGALALDG